MSSPSILKNKVSYDVSWRGRVIFFCSWLAGFIFFIFYIIAVTIDITLGFATFGYLWPTELKEVLYYGTPVEVAASGTKHIVTTEVEKVKMEVNMLHRKVEERIEKLEEDYAQFCLFKDL